MTYIVVSENEIVKAERGRPDRNIYDENGNLFWTWEDYLLSLPRISAPGHKWERWREVVEGKDFKFGQTDCKLGREGCICFPYLEKWCPDAIYIAIPIQPTQNKIVKEDMICPETGKYCDDECCTVGSICNVSGSTDGISPQPTPEAVKIKNMTITEKKQPSFGVNDEVYILDTEIYDTPKWIHGVVEEVGDESILVKWDDLTDPTEYQLSDLPDIRHREPTPEGEKDYQKSVEGNYAFDRNKWQATYAGDILLIHKKQPTHQR